MINYYRMFFLSKVLVSRNSHFNLQCYYRGAGGQAGFVYTRVQRVTRCIIERRSFFDRITVGKLQFM